MSTFPLEVPEGRLYADAACGLLYSNKIASNCLDHR